MGFYPADIARICAEDLGVDLTGLRSDERKLGPVVCLMKKSGTLYERITIAINERLRGKFKAPAISVAEVERLFQKYRDTEAAKDFSDHICLKLLNITEKREANASRKARKSAAKALVTRLRNRRS